MEHNAKYMLYKENIDKENNGNNYQQYSYELEMNQFADLTN